MASHLAVAGDTERSLTPADVEKAIQTVGPLTLLSEKTEPQGQVSRYAIRGANVTVSSYSDADVRRGNEPTLHREPLDQESFRGVGNVLVRVQGGDADLRYRILAALEALVQ